ncbi:DUF4381 family protein, partial [Bordetella pertussis]|uniref:DUF4381 family protein n=1 Tax=Bordetella pertussis TaxID=520 RepID=UPI0036727F33
MSDALPGLDQLQELPLPAAVPYWPQTWGWAVLAALVLAGAAWACPMGRPARRGRPAQWRPHSGWLPGRSRSRRYPPSR